MASDKLLIAQGFDSTTTCSQLRDSSNISNLDFALALKTNFDKLDADGNGKISRKDLKSAVANEGLSKETHLLAEALLTDDISFGSCTIVPLYEQIANLDNSTRHDNELSKKDIAYFEELAIHEETLKNYHDSSTFANGNRLVSLGESKEFKEDSDIPLFEMMSEGRVLQLARTPGKPNLALSEIVLNFDKVKNSFDDGWMANNIGISHNDVISYGKKLMNAGACLFNTENTLTDLAEKHGIKTFNNKAVEITKASTTL